MRYAERLTLHQTIGSGYNPETGKTEVQVDEGVTLPCNASPVSLERVKTIFGSIDKEVTSVRLQRPFKDKADKAMMDGKKYNVLRHVSHRSESVFYLEEVSSWN
ncbi:hypothetical protein SAMN05192559_1086 [Halobacillus karajensis]|uniref:Phage head-tail adaptor n=1 Tax=Halobacillus karajensis TaxID=195088 RepID=A0A024P4K9_9BACI|nr:hypothetical protein [Halobacillus karajensis]CDQ20857.1 hypothetical protein BN982_03212 [Halobacillus karajensis]CDQ23673.1 hypothetical protein BN983_01924 [Halobacillus karajensis]CDQ27151.1 hypothetical protein BN981_01405 [Halobacillus karajensis]SEI03629.1 hypothetical protein SAMN05192559_1086 [Halobacillus karajensis]